ncbi:anhydro-N-acetylmuramic acid kinase [Asanoa ferruginea]|uniref:Anhydro-N-acetylmuramic acid kinase n=1 Tax=Asanoa ferruginea TaxID=53367 RepID=A0A3D9ZT64_9ACTN|nr:anhydro-N-acetylmuramic acid kinase [Asanoa ferruginea]REG00442.1 anhydro-N-acetylmuramic acid kinase [Asanoa ferruginea]GIF50983.1 anhydro-N-acetylmuramic acid kinase [Asanoa ferruginea]
MRVLGLSSGTSHDGIDAALVDFSLPPGGDTLRARLLHHATTPYEPALRAAILAALPPHKVGLGDVCALDTRLGHAFARAATSALDAAGPAELVCSHGQTLFHAATDGTLQLGQPAWIAERTGLPVVADVRVRDVAAGGQGAPLVPVLDLMLLAGREGRWGAVNLGGIANLTVAVPDETCAYDTGPGNALIDAAALAVTGEPYDRGGALAASGTVRTELLDRLLVEPYYARNPPKSTGKELFSAAYLDGAGGYQPADLLATLTELTAATVGAELRRHRLDHVLVSGGGVRNRTLLKRLAARAPGVTFVPSDEFGLPADAKEAVLFALIGWLTWHGLPGAVPSATGANGGRLLGAVTPGAAPLRLPAPLTTLPRRLELE